MGELTQAERLALDVALAQVLRGEAPTPNVARVCVLALGRLADAGNWTCGHTGDHHAPECIWASPSSAALYKEETADE